MLPIILLLRIGGQSEQLAIIGIVYRVQAGFPGGSAVKNLPVIQETQEMQFHPWVGKILWRRVWQPIPAFLPGVCQEEILYRVPPVQRNLVGYSPDTESGTTEATEPCSTAFRLWDE